MAESATPEQKVIVVDFGAQYGQLHARRVRDLHVPSKSPCDITAEEVRAIAPAAIILSGGPASVRGGRPSIDSGDSRPGYSRARLLLRAAGAMAVALAGKWPHREGASTAQQSSRGRASRRCSTAPPGEQTVDEPLRRAVSRVPEGLLHHVAHRGVPGGVHGIPRAAPVRHAVPSEVRHTEFGQTMLRNFLFGVCELESIGRWTPSSTTPSRPSAPRWGDDRVILGLSAAWTRPWWRCAPAPLANS